MKFYITAAFAAFVAMPVQAQNLAGTPAVPTTITGRPGGPAYINDGYPTTTTPIVQYCLDPNQPTPGGTAHPGTCTAVQLARNAKDYWGSISFDAAGNFLGSLPSTTITSIPSGVVASGSLVGVTASGVYQDPSSPSGLALFSGVVPLSSFASASSVQSLQESLNAYVASQQALADRLEQSQIAAAKGVAMASSLYVIAPAEGKSNRLAFGVGTYAGQVATSVNYTRRAGSLDMAVSAAFSSNTTLGKAGVGFSW